MTAFENSSYYKCVRKGGVFGDLSLSFVDCFTSDSSAFTNVIGGIIMSMFLRKNKNKKKKAVPTCLILNDKCKYPMSVSCEQCYIKQEIEKESGKNVR